MARSARDEQKKDKREEQPPKPVIGDKRLAIRLSTPSPTMAAIRTLIFVEVGDVPSAQISQAVEQISSIHGRSMHPTFILPIRNGKLSGDLLFEKELLKFINDVCMIKDGEIVFKDDAKEVDVLRQCF